MQGLQDAPALSQNSCKLLIIWPTCMQEIANESQVMQQLCLRSKLISKDRDNSRFGKHIASVTNSNWTHRNGAISFSFLKENFLKLLPECWCTSIKKMLLHLFLSREREFIHNVVTLMYCIKLPDPIKSHKNCLKDYAFTNPFWSDQRKPKIHVREARRYLW